MAVTLTQDDINAIAEQVLEEIINSGTGSSTLYDQNSPFPTPTTEAEQELYTIPMIKNLGTDDEQAGNINARELLEGFGSEIAQLAEEAESNLTLLQGYKDDAEDAASSATNAASTASTKASQAAQSATDAASDASTAVSAKNAALQAQQAAEEARDEAQSISGATGAVSTIIGNNLTANRVLVSDANGKVAVSGMILDTLNYLVGYKNRLVGRCECGVGPRWYLGLQENLPERCFILNGQNLPIPTNINDDYWYAYKEWGTKYNTEETPSGYFGTPDFMTRADGTNGPNYIGSTGDFAQVGQKLIDTIRNIRSEFNFFTYGGSDPYGGASSIILKNKQLDYGTVEALTFTRIFIDASQDSHSPYNPMIGHTGDNIHPFTILSVPIYVY